VTIPAEFGPDAREAVLAASAEAERMHHEYVGTEHLLLALLQNRSVETTTALRRLGVTPTVVRERVHAVVKSGRDAGEPGPATEPKPFTRRCVTSLEAAVAEARRLDHPALTPGDLLVGLLLEQRGIAAQLLGEAGVGVDALRVALETTEPGG